MIDNFSILLSHALLALALWLLTNRPDLDIEAPPPPDIEPEGFARRRPPVVPVNKGAPDA